jgi:hypothetical protein
MTVQHILVAALAALAAWYLVRQTWRTWAKGCSGGCCGGGDKAPSPTPALIPAEDLLVRARRGSRSADAHP